LPESASTEFCKRWSAGRICEKEPIRIQGAYKIQTVGRRVDQALVDHVLDDGRVALPGGDVGAKAEAHDAGGPYGFLGEAELLVLNLLAVDGDGVVEVVALDAPPIEVGDVKAALVDQIERTAII